MAGVRRRRRRHEVRATRPDPPWQRRRSGHPLALGVARQRDRGPRRRSRTRGLRVHPADEERRPLHQHIIQPGGRHRRRDRPAALALRPEELRVGTPSEQRLPPPRARLVDGRRDGDGVPGNRRRPPDRARSGDRHAPAGVRQPRHRGPHSRHPLPERQIRPVRPHLAADRRWRRGRRRLVGHGLGAAAGMAARRRPRLPRPHRPAPVDLPYRAAPRPVRLLDLGRRLRRTGRRGQRMGADDRRPGTRLRLPAGERPVEPLLRRPPQGRQPVRQQHRLSRRQDRPPCLALPDRPSRHLGLRPPGAAQPGRHHGRRPRDPHGRAGHQAGLGLRVRPAERQAGVADPRGSGPAVDRAGRANRADPAAADETAAFRPAGHHAGGSGRRRRGGARRPRLGGRSTRPCPPAAPSSTRVSAAARTGAAPRSIRPARGSTSRSRGSFPSGSASTRPPSPATTCTNRASCGRPATAIC